MIPQMIPLFGDTEKKYVAEYMDNVGFITEFELTQKFEEELKTFTQIKNCSVVNNGTVALLASYYAAGLRPGDEVLMPNYTMFATYSAAKVLGLEVVLVDICPQSAWIDPRDLEQKITENSKAFVTVTTNGRYPNVGYQCFRDIAEKYNLTWIEDAAQGLGSKDIDGSHVGSKADIMTLSFSAPKIISTGQGGAILTNDTELAAKVKLFKDFGRSSGGQDFHETIGLNLKFTELQAAIGLAQMTDLDRRIIRKKEIYEFYRTHIDNTLLELIWNDTRFTAPWFYEIKSHRKEDLTNYLMQNGVGCRSVYPPLNSQQAINNSDAFPRSRMHSEQTLWIPSAVQLTDQELTHIVRVLNRFK